jgi:hypothetical protein
MGVCVCRLVSVLVLYLNMILLYTWFTIISRGICFNYYIRESMFSVAYGVLYK